MIAKLLGILRISESEHEMNNDFLQLGKWKGKWKRKLMAEKEKRGLGGISNEWYEWININTVFES